VPTRTTVLVIDDEGPIRSLIRRMLEPEVCRILEAEDGEAGLRLIEQADPPVDAVLTDWVMKGLHGLDVVEVLHRHRPGLPVAVISAYTSTIHPIVRSEGNLQILQKPFTIPDLRGAVLEMIRQAAVQRARARQAPRYAHAAPTGRRAAHHGPVDLVGAAWALHRARATSG
jgi:two-component system cell cycle sensor histidine kinase/response regulator CckA